MLNPQAPGVYLKEQKFTLNPLQIDSRCLTGLVGIAERGPLHTPVLIKSFDEYLKIFGSFETVGNLPFSVYNYFRCGGQECVIVRIANEQEASRAKLVMKCIGGGSVVLEANSEGIWGNYITVRTWHEAEFFSPASVDTLNGEWIACDEEEIKAQDVLRFSLCGQQFYRTVSRKENNTAYLDRPIKLFGKASLENIQAERVFASVAISYKNESENFLHLSMNPMSDRYYFSYINSRSRLCKIYKKNPKGIIKTFFMESAAGGKDGIAEMTAGDFIGHYDGLNQFRGLGALESRDDVALIAMTDISWLAGQAGKTDIEPEEAMYAVYTAMVSQAERFPGRFAILDMPYKLEGLKALNWAKKFDSPFAAAYYPFIDVLDPTDQTGTKTVRVPPSGAICGCIAAMDSEKGIFNAPANRLLEGAVGLSAKITDSEYEILYPAGINLLKYFPGRGIKIWGARTLSSNPDWRYINVRRTFSAIGKSLKQGTQWAVFETNDKKLWKRIVRQVSGFLLDLWMKGYLAGSTAEQGYFVRCDDELNPPENVDKGVVTFEVGLAITRPTEFFIISITAEKEGASVYIQEN